MVVGLVVAGRCNETGLKSAVLTETKIKYVKAQFSRQYLRWAVYFDVPPYSLILAY